MSIDNNFEKYNKENLILLENKKDSLLNKLQLINERLTNSNNINEFLRKQQYETMNERDDSIKCENECLVMFLIKFIGTIFVTLYLIGVFEIIDIMSAIQEELIISIKMYFSNEKIEDRKDFYWNYINIATQIPSFSPFFLSSMLSDIIINIIGMYFTTLLVIVVNILTLFFGLNSFIFHKDEKLSENYTFKEFLILLVIYLGLYLSIGLVALVPIDIVQEGFKEFDRHKSISLYKGIQNFRAKIFAGIHMKDIEFSDYEESFNEEKKRLDEKIKEEEIKSKEGIMKKKLDNLEMSENAYKNFFLEYKKTINGFLIFYIFSMSISSICVIIINRIYLFNFKEDNLYNNILLIIIFFTSPMIFSLFFYFLYSIIFLDNNKKNDKEIDIKKFGGYIIYQETSNSDRGCCASCLIDCSECFKKLNYGCCCQICSCSYICKSIFCCKCSCEHNRREEIDTRDKEKTKICIIYKINGICSWIINLLTNPRTLIFVPFLYLFYALNIGFDSSTSEDFNNDITKKSILNVAILSSRLLLYSINYFGGKWLNLILHSAEENKDFYVILYGLILVIISEAIFSSVISILIYSNIFKNDIKQFLIIISHKSTEYIEIVCLEYFSFYLQINIPIGEFLSTSSILSLYLFVWKAFEFLIIDIINVSNASLLIFKYTFGMALATVLIIFIFYLKRNPKVYEVINDFINALDPTY